MPRHYFLPTINVSFCEIPKNGSTSLKNYLFALEQESSRSNLETPASIQFFGQTIHGNPEMKDFQVKNIKDKRVKQSLRILILRNPYQRVLSSWVNKLLFAQHDYMIFRQLRHEPFTPVDFSSVEDLDQAFEKFAEKLSRNKEFLYSNNHWRPQVEFYGDISDYDVVLETSEIARLESIVWKHLGLQSDPKPLPFPQFNQSKSLLVSQIGTTRAWDFVQSTYSEDLDVMSKAGLNVRRPDETPKHSEPLSPEAFEAEKILILESRSASEPRSHRLQIQGLQDQIRDLKASRSWRWTAWLRWISAFWLGRR
jgi:hypothetical protein